MTVFLRRNPASILRTQRLRLLNPEHLHHFIAKVVDDFQGDPIVTALNLGDLYAFHEAQNQGHFSGKTHPQCSVASPTRRATLYPSLLVHSPLVIIAFHQPLAGQVFCFNVPLSLRNNCKLSLQRPWKIREASLLTGKAIFWSLAFLQERIAVFAVHLIE